MADAKARGDRDRRQQMGGIEQTDIELVANIRPRDFPNQRDVKAFCGGNPLSTATISAAASTNGMKPT